MTTNYVQLNSTLLEQIRNNKNTYKHFKNQIIQQQNYFDENLMGFALLIALHFDDNEFINLLSQRFDFDNEKYSFKHKNLPCVWIAFAKAYVCIKNKNHQQAKHIFWRIFVEVSPEFFAYDDFLLLSKLFAEFENNSENYYLLLSYSLHKFSNKKDTYNILDFQLQVAKFELLNIFNSDFTKYNFESRKNTNLLLLEQHYKTPKQLTELADICYLLQDKNNFFKYFEKAILLSNFPVFNMYKYTGSNANVAMNPNFDADKYLQAVNEVIDILENAGLQPFIESGTLLGLYRNGKLMNYDYDADLGIFIDNFDNTKFYVETICKSFENIPNYFVTYKLYYDDSINKNIYFVNIIKQENKHNKKANLQISIDIEFYYKNYYGIKENADKIYVGFGYIMWEFDNFDLQLKTINNKQYFIPTNCENYLQQLYGNDWQTPTSLWDSKISSPNIVKNDKCKFFVYHYGMHRLFRELGYGNYEVANFYYCELQRWEYPFTEAMKKHIENYLLQIKPNIK